MKTICDFLKDKGKGIESFNGTTIMNGDYTFTLDDVLELIEEYSKLAVQEQTLLSATWATSVFYKYTHAGKEKVNEFHEDCMNTTKANIKKSDTWN